MSLLFCFCFFITQITHFSINSLNLYFIVFFSEFSLVCFFSLVFSNVGYVLIWMFHRWKKQKTTKKKMAWIIFQKSDVIQVNLNLTKCYFAVWGIYSSAMTMSMVTAQWILIGFIRFFFLLTFLSKKLFSFIYFTYLQIVLLIHVSTLF